MASVNLDDSAMADAETIRLGLGGDWSGGRGEDWRWDRMAANLRSFRVSGASQDRVG